MPRIKKQPTLESQPNIWLDSKTNRYKWELRLRRENGSQFRKAGSANTLEKAITARDAAQKEFDAGGTVSKKITLAEFAEKCMERIWIGELRQRTLSSYRGLIRRHLVKGIGDMYLTSITSDDVRKLLTSIELDDHSRANLRTVISKIYSTAQQESPPLVPIGFNPAKAVKIQRNKLKRDGAGNILTHKRTLDLDEQTKLLDVARHSPIYGVVLVGLKMGLRINEILGMTWQNVDLERGYYHVKWQLERIEGKGLQLTEPKTRSSIRRLPLPKSVVEFLQSQGQNGQYVFHDDGKPLIYEHVARQFKVLCQVAGLMGACDQFGVAKPDVTPHDLRHSYAWTMANVHHVTPKDLSKLLGHSSIITTLSVYVDATDCDLESAVAKIA